MRTFAELLTEYTTRTGISDAELARTLGVRRQTIFRWKEGLVARPRNVEDVLRCATRLRLTPEERDLLLVAAGFPPEGTPPVSSGVATGEGTPDVYAGRAATADEKAPLTPQPWSDAPASFDSVRQTTPDSAQDASAGIFRTDAHAGRGATADENSSGGSHAAARSGMGARPAGAAIFRTALLRSPLAWLFAALLLLALAGALFLAIRWARGAAYPVAGRGETLIVIGRFVNYTGGQEGYNVAGRVQATLTRETTAGRLTGVRVALWPGEIPDEDAAEAAARRSGAALVIWGEYDSGRVLTHFTIPGAGAELDQHRLEKPFASPAELPTTINSALPEEVRYLALLTLGQLSMDRGDFAAARATLTQALARPPADPIALATLYTTLGYAYHVGQPADLDQAISFYSQAAALAPETVSVYNNRGIAYLSRGQAGDYERAIADLTAFVTALPDSALAYTNRGIAYFQMGGAENLAHAVADFDRAVALAPEAPDTYFSRGLAYTRLGNAPRWQADFERTLALAPDHAGAHNALCWAYALDNQPAQALPYCDRALALDPAGPTRDSRGIVYAELDRTAEAISDFEAYLAGLRAQGDRAYQRYGPRREAWLAALRAGRNPFDQTTLDQLRQE